MHTYEIAGETYYAAGSKLYTARDETHGLDAIDDHAIHLYEHPDWDEPRLARLEWGGEIYSTVSINPVEGKSEAANRSIWADEFEGATPVESVVPEEIHECPGCGGWAGPIEDDEPRCLACGYGYDDYEP